MKERIMILLLCLPVGLQLFGQQPPKQLPSLFEGMDLRTPAIHKNETPEDIIRQHIFVKLTASKKEVYVGEPILVMYKLYTSLNSQSRVSKQPAFTGCSVTELSQDNEPSVGTLEGKQYHIYTIRKVQVTPLQAGTMQLGQAFVDNVVALANEDETTVQNYSATLGNDPLSIEVKDLPEEGKPNNFTGLVGDFSIDASLDSNSVPAGENAILQITINGTGNIEAVHVPVVQWPLNTEHFDGSDTQHIDQDNFPTSGYKTFRIPFIGDKEGTSEIAPISFSFFDPASDQYKTVSTKKLLVHFTKPVTAKQEVNESLSQNGVSNNKYIWIVAAIAAAVIITVLAEVWLKAKKKKDVQLIKQIKEVPKQEEQAAALSNKTWDIFSALNELGSINNTKDFLSSTKTLLTKALQLKLNVQGYNEQQLITALKKHETFAGIASVCENIYATCNRNLYAPNSENGIKEKIYFDLTAVVKKMVSFEQ